MTTTTQHAPGTFCWPELATTDQSGAKAFYTELLGWQTEDTPMGDGQVYTMFLLGGRPLGAVYNQPPEERKMAPPHWNSYISVADADAAAAKAASLGGTVIVAPFEVMEHGRMAILQDPTGAVFCVWQARKHPGAGVLDEVGALCWTELMTPDAARAGAFYTALVGWTTQTMPMGPGQTYTIFQRGATQAAGMMQITPEMGPIPPNWMPYFAVSDCDGTATKAGKLGGKVTVPPTDIPNVGRFAVLQDPQGAYVSILRLDRLG